MDFDAGAFTVNAPGPGNPYLSDEAGAIMLETDNYTASRVAMRLMNIIGDRPYPLNELILMYSAFEFHRPEIVIDVGTHYGKSARVWHELSKLLHTKTAIHTIDILDKSHSEYPGDSYAKYINRLPVNKHIGDGATVANEIIWGNPGNILLFLDGDHHYGPVRNELEKAKNINSGCILVHDTFYQPGSSYVQDPYNAVQDFVKEHPVKQVIYTATGLPGMSYIGL